MGCGKSKDAEADPKIVFVVKATGINEVDTVLEAFKNDCEVLEKLRRDLEDTRAEARSISGTIRLVDEKIRFAEACKVFLWTVSANYSGKIATSNIKIEQTAPVLTLNTNNLVGPDSEKLYKAIQDYLQAAVDANESFKKGFDNLKAQKDRIIGLKDNLKELLNGKDGGEKLKITQAMASNVQQTQEVFQKLNKLRILCDEQQKEEQQIVRDLEEFILQADKVGEQAYREKHLKPLQIFEKYHSGEKLPEATI